MPTVTSIPIITATEAAALINDRDIIGFSGFTPAGAAKDIPTAIAARASEEHAQGRPFKIGVVTGASTGDSLDGELARANAMLFRTPYQSCKDLRVQINKGETCFYDMHLSMLPQAARYGFLGKVKYAVVEAASVSEEGEIVLTTSVGASNTFCNVADKILIELNEAHPAELQGLHDIYEPLDPPHRREIPLYSCSDRCGSPVLKVDPEKIIGIVKTNRPDEVGGFKDTDEVTKRIGENVAIFLAEEIKAGRIPKEFLPIQSGVGNIANAVLGALGENPNIPPFEMYSEVVQDSVIGLMRSGDVKFASATSLTVSPPVLKEVYEDLEFFKQRMVLRPQEISNHPEIVRRLGIISINTAIEADIWGNINSTHVMGNNLMNGIGGSGDFTRNAYISIFTCPSVAKGGAISTIVPMVAHLDHSEHSVQVLVTDQGVADLRGKDPAERAREIVDKCAHPEYRDQLHAYFDDVKDGHTPQTLRTAFAMHEAFMQKKDMRGVDWSSKYSK
ncbi:acetyl-CoA hydrolase/transferase family protein [Coraliomargarita sp. SDUM461004]|uniref:Acetyl-CoA hydrolase/transferase family protein n=1 Tax=Thalassobacterium sedimentorum TaxID=3041258 RepID=A0ABU1AKI3_9BACT|nr:acetyl-CoA hydrolase/transferase family protein [Coraliomargarita sp. SDUM461004]MDQ8194093.1 acetyl-CoA hydrolase/transferase family protein [Coraliomargarita sp. SDUM461004]